MREFRVPLSNRGVDPRIRLLVWQMIAVVFGLCLAIYSATTPGLAFRKPLFLFSVVIIIGSLVTFGFYGLRAGFGRVKYDLQFGLTETELTRKRTGWPEVQIKLSEIKALREAPAWLVVSYGDARKRIGIPRDIDGYDALRTELAKHAPFEEAKRRSPLGLVMLPASILLWSLVLWSEKDLVALMAGAAALLLLIWSSLSLHRGLKQSPKRVWLWLLLGIAWLCAVVLIGIRVLRAFPN